MNKYMNHDDAKRLWDSIVNHADAQALLEGEGNSGEFHSSRDMEELTVSAEKAQEALIETFEALTGWKPVFIEETDYSKPQKHWIQPHWILNKCETEE